MKNFISLTIIILTTFSAYSQKNFKADDVIGFWITEENKSMVQIYKEDGKYFGKIVWLKEPKNDKGEEKKDKNNPKEKLQNRTLKGLIVMRNYVFNGDKWEDGKVYDPESGNTYSGYFSLESKDIMKLRGYIGISLIGRTSTWKRYTKKEKRE